MDKIYKIIALPFVLLIAISCDSNTKESNEAFGALLKKEIKFPSQLIYQVKDSILSNLEALCHDEVILPCRPGESTCIFTIYDADSNKVVLHPLGYAKLSI